MGNSDDRGSVIQEFYRDASIFITGGTGTLGKVLIEKLLRSCPHIRNIFLLVRSKDGKSVETRLDEIFEDSLFDVVKMETPDFRQKITVVPSNSKVGLLNISSSAERLLIEEVNIVFHLAATVKPDEMLYDAYHINLLGTQSLIYLMHEMKKLKAVIHMSTLYSNCQSPLIEEKFYTYSSTYKNLKYTADSMNDSFLNATSRTVVAELRNVYNYSKAMTEDLVMDQGVGLPIGVFRPAIVTSTYKEPMPGWIDKIHGPHAIMVGGAVGLVRCAHGDGEKVANLIPLDITINALIVSAWDVANRPRSQCKDDIPFFNCESSVQNPITWKKMINYVTTSGKSLPTEKRVWYPYLKLVKSNFLYVVFVTLFHFIPAVFSDAVTLLIAKKPRLTTLYKQIYRFSYEMSFFTTEEWKFTNGNVQELWNKLKGNDKLIFYFDVKEIDWRKYCEDYVKGAITFVTKNDMSAVFHDPSLSGRLYIIQNITVILFSFLVLKFLWTLYGIIV